MAGLNDIGSLLPFLPIDEAPDLASLHYPWSDPPPAITGPELQPGIGVPASALDAAAPPPPVMGPPAEGAPPAPPQPPPDVADHLAAPPPPPAPYGADVAPPPPLGAGELPPGVAGPPAPTVREMPDLTVRPDPGDQVLQQEHEDARQRDLNDLALRDPAAFAELQVRDQQARADFTARRRKEMADADIAAVRQHAEDLKAANAATQAKMDALLVDAERIFNTKIDPTGGVTGSRRIAGILAAAIGGLVQGRTGSSRNAGMDALNDAINRGIESQKADLARQTEGVRLRHSVLAAEFARHGDMYQAEETVRLAALKHADDLLATEQQNYDPRGRTGILIASQRQQITAAQQTAVQAFQQKTFENSVKLQDAKRQQQIADDTALHNRQQIGLGYAQLDSAAADRKAAADARAADKAAERADKEAERDRQFAIGGMTHLQLDDKGAPVLGPDGKPVISHDDLRNADGTRWRAASPEEHGKLTEKKTAATQLVKIYDRILALRDRVGGESRVWNSNEYQELKGLEKEALLLKKEGTQGMSSDKDMDNLVDAAGVNDVTSFRARAAGIEAARARTIDKLNQGFRDARYTGPDLAFPEHKPTQNTPAEDDLQRLLEKPKGGIAEDVNAEIKRRTLGLSPDEQKAAGKLIPSSFEDGDRIDILTPAQREVYREVAKTYSSDISGEQRRLIRELAAAAVGTSPPAIEASAKLQRVATEAKTAALRQLAAAALEEAMQADLGSPELPPVHETVHEAPLPPVPAPGMH